MCKGISMVITRGRLEPYWIKGENSHTIIKVRFNIRDGEQLSSLPIEFHPTGVLTDVNDWVFHIDSNCPLPGWFTEQREEYEKECHYVLETVIDALAKTKTYEGNLNLQHTEVSSLGSLVNVDGDINLRFSKVQSLGSLMTVWGCLDLSHTKIVSLGSLLKVYSVLSIAGTNICKVEAKKICKAVSSMDFVSSKEFELCVGV